LFKYTPETGRRSDIHTDSGCLSFTIALNEAGKEFIGGGTWFEGLQPPDDHVANNEHDPNVLEMSTGQVTIRPGGVKHAGHAVRSGTRYIIGGFCMHRNKPEVVRQLLSSSHISAGQTPTRLLEAAVAWNPACDASYSVLADHYEKVLDDVTRAQHVLEYCLQHVHPQSSPVAYALGSLYYQQQQQHGSQGEQETNWADGIRQCMQTCLNVDSNDVGAMKLAAEAYAQLGDITQQRAMYERIVYSPTVQASPDDQAMAYCSLGLLQEGTDAELECYQRALAVQPNHFGAWYSLAAAYGSRQDWNAAIETFRQAVPHATTPELEHKALQGLYQAASFLLRNDSNQPPPTSREEIIARFRNIMGSENWDRLAVLSAKP